MPVHRVSSVYSATTARVSKQQSFGDAPKTSAVKTQPAQKSAVKKALPYVAGAVLLAGAGILIYRNKSKAKNLAQAGADLLEHNKVKLGNNEIIAKINEVKNAARGETERIIVENTNKETKILNLDGMDAAGLMRAKDKTRPNYLHEAANMIEESYKAAYSQDTKLEGNLFNKIGTRLDKESKALIDVYSEMPYNEALERAKFFTDDLAAADKKAGMSAKEFFGKIAEMIDLKKPKS